MAKARAIVKRRKAVANIRKITRTMQLIATARYQAAYNRAVRVRPYTERITQLAEQVARSNAEIDHPLLQAHSDSGRAVLIVISSNRGLCGSYSASLMRAGAEKYRELKSQSLKVDFFAVGKKLVNYLRFHRIDIWRRDDSLAENVRFEAAESLANELIELYRRRQVDAVYVTYMRFISTASQRVETIKLLPIEPPAEADLAEPETAAQYEFLPSKDELLSELLPETVRVRLFQCLIDAAVSEQVARMVAMKAATDAAGDMMRSLTQQYNRARQSQITLELLDIVSGAEALK